MRKEFVIVELEQLMNLKPSQVVRNIVAVQDVSLSISAGQVYGFLGPNGAGKTTTIKMCMDLIKPSKGSIRLFGKRIGDRTLKARVGYMPEHPYFYDYLKPQEILDLFGRIFGLSKAVRLKRIDELLDRVGLKHARNRSLRKFSKGMLQRLGIAQALINEPDFLVLDEPLSGLDPVGRKEIRDIIIEQRSKGTTIFFSSHILSDIEHLCDRIAIIDKGFIVREGPLSDMLQSGTRQTEILVQVDEERLGPLCDKFGVKSIALGNTSRVIIESDNVTPFIQRVVEAGGLIDQVQPYRDSLEALFIRSTGQN